MSDHTPIDVDDLLMAIGELYVQVRVLRKIIQQQQLHPPSPVPPIPPSHTSPANSHLDSS